MLLYFQPSFMSCLFVLVISLLSVDTKTAFTFDKYEGSSYERIPILTELSKLPCKWNIQGRDFYGA